MKITIVGAGRVGSAIAFSLLHELNANEIILLDILKNLAEGEALDLNHAAMGIKKKTKFSGGDDFSLAANSDFIVLTAGRPTKQGEVREDLLKTNAPIVEDVCRKLENCRNATIIIVTNPVAEISEICKKYFSKIIPMANQLDTSRAKFIIGRELNMPAGKIKSFVTGGHGESMAVEFLDRLNDAQKEKIMAAVRNAAWEIRDLKGGTWWGIAAHVAEEVKRLARTK